MKIDKSDRLVKLIKSLNPNEKRHFKLSVLKEKKGENAYFMKLYDLIDRALAKRNSNEEFNIAEKDLRTIKNLSFNKRYLFETILKNLRPFHWAPNPIMKIHLINLDVSLLKKKGFHKEALVLIAKGKKLAYKYELHGLALMFIKHEVETVAFSKKDFNYNFNLIEKRLEEAKKILASYDESIALTGRRFQSFLIESEAALSMSPHLQKKLLSLVGEMKIKEETFSTMTKVNYNDTNAVFQYYVKKDYSKSSDYSKNSIDLLSSHPDFIENYSLGLYSWIYQYCSVCLKAGKYDEISKYLAVLKMEPFKFISYAKRNENVDSTILTFMHLIKLKLLLVKGDQQEVNEADAETKKLIAKYGDSIPGESYFQMTYYMSINLFSIGENKRSTFYLKKILHSPETTFKREIHLFALFLRALIHYESSDFEKLDSSYSSILVRLNNFSNPLEDVYLRMALLICKELALINTRSEVTAKLIALKSEITIAEKKKGVKFNEYLMAWVESKIEKVPFAKKMLEVN